MGVKRKNFVHGWRECKVVQLLWKTVWRVLKTRKIELPYDPTIPLLKMYLENTKTLIWKDTCTPMFTVALFTIARTWTRPTCPSAHGWVKMMWLIYKHSGIPPSHKKNEILPLAATMDGLGGRYAKWNTSDRERQILYDIAYLQTLKEYNKVVNQTKQNETQRHREQTSGYQWGEGRSGGDLHNKTYSLTILEAESPRWRRCRGWVLQRPHSPACRRLSSVCVSTYILISSSYKDTRQLASRSTLETFRVSQVALV